MKKCTNCHIKKEYSSFYEKDGYKDGRISICNVCSRRKNSEYQKTVKGLITRIYAHQKFSSKRRGHNLPDYSVDDLFLKLSEDENFLYLYNGWVDSNYQSRCKPSIDRLDDNKPYSFTNIRVTTWEENRNKSHQDQITGKLISNHKAVIQYSKDTLEVIGKFVSTKHAQRETGVSRCNIGRCCSGIRLSAGGYIWKFA